MQPAAGGGSGPVAAPPAPAAAPPAPCTCADSSLRSHWGSLSEPLLLLVMASLDHSDLAAAHRVARGWRDATRLAVRRMHFCEAPPDTERIKQARHSLCSPVALLSWLEPSCLSRPAGQLHSAAPNPAWRARACWTRSPGIRPPCPAGNCRATARPGSCLTGA